MIVRESLEFKRTGSSKRSLGVGFERLNDPEWLEDFILDFDNRYETNYQMKEEDVQKSLAEIYLMGNEFLVKDLWITDYARDIMKLADDEEYTSQEVMDHMYEHEITPLLDQGWKIFDTIESRFTSNGFSEWVMYVLYRPTQ